LGRELGLEANLERAQEIIYEAARAWVQPPEELREFAHALGLSPSALAARDHDSAEETALSETTASD
jgi:hypothetical protein